MLKSRTSAGTILAVVAFTGCGTTVQQSAIPAGSGNPLSVPSAGASAGASAPGVPGTPVAPAGPGAISGTGPNAAGGVVRPGTAPGSSGPGATLPPASQPKTGPLPLGVLDASSPTAAEHATGGNNPAGVDPVAITHAFIKYYNDHGGMSGRKIQPIEYTINPTSPSYQSDLSAACAKFTQDNHVNVVLSQVGNAFSANYESCLAKAGVTNIEVGNGAPDAQDERNYPQLFTTASPTVDRRVTAVLRGLTHTGLLTPRTKLGVIVEDCPENTRAYSNTFAPLARSLGLTVVRSDVDCVTGFADAGSFFTQVGRAELPFRSDGVSRVTFMTSFEVAALQAFENTAQSQGYKPDYALSSLAVTAANASQYPADAQRRMFGVGWLPVGDITGLPHSAATKRCDAVARAEGITAKSQADYTFLYQICDLFRVLDASLVAAHGHDEATALPAGVSASMQSFRSAYVLGGRLRLDRNVHDAPLLFSAFGYQQNCTCFRYSTPPARLA
jgi:ABC-type branched-subunit amino acid transport system substrate-binding protein